MPRRDRIQSDQAHSHYDKAAALVSALGIYLLIVNAVTFLTYAYDKSAAGRAPSHASRRASRVPERNLYLLAAVGGSPAAWLGQRLLRHKTQKPSFLWRFRAIVVLQIALVGVWLWHVYH